MVKIRKKSQATVKGPFQPPLSYNKESLPTGESMFREAWKGKPGLPDGFFGRDSWQLNINTEAVDCDACI